MGYIVVQRQKPRKEAVPRHPRKAVVVGISTSTRCKESDNSYYGQGREAPNRRPQSRGLIPPCCRVLDAWLIAPCCRVLDVGLIAPCCRVLDVGLIAPCCRVLDAISSGRVVYVPYMGIPTAGIASQASIARVMGGF